MKSWRWAVVLLIIGSLVLASCAQASPVAEKAAVRVSTYAERSERFALRLPAVYVQYGSDGVLSVAGFTTNQLYQWTGIDLRMLNLQPWVVQRLVDADIQHIEVAEDAKGLAVYVNGKPLPYVSWDGDSLQNLGDMLAVFDVPYAPVIKAVLPLVRFTRLSVVVQFPIRPGAAVIPMRARNAPAVVAARASSVTSPVAVVRLDITYDSKGMPSLFGLDAGTLAGMGIDVRPLALNPALVKRFMAHNIQHIHFVNRPDGIHIYVNNKPLPYPAWDEEHIQNAVDLYQRLTGDTQSPVFTLVTQILPELRRSDVDLLLRFPVPEGKEAIPVLEAPAQ